MQKIITARHFDLTPEMKARAEEEMDGLTRFFDRIVSAEFVLSAEKHRRLAELHVKVHAQTLTASAETDDIITAIASAADKVTVQLKKYKSKMKDKDPGEVTDLMDATTRPDTDVEGVDM